MIIWLSGPTGAGKSSLAECFKKIGYGVVHEEVPNNLFQDFLHNPSVYCAQLQSYIVTSRYNQWDIIANERNIVFDRSIDEDISIFCRLHYEKNFLTMKELVDLRNLANDLQRHMPQPDLIIYLSPNTNVLRDRMTSEGHPDLIVNGIDRQVFLYEEWISLRNNSVLRIDNSFLKKNHLKEIFGA